MHLIDSLMKGIKILYVDSDEKRAVDIESKAEGDQDLSRSLFYVASNSQEASKLVRQQNIDICIYPDGLDGHDFVYIQKELQAANPKIKIIPLIGKVVTLKQINEFRQSVSVISFANNDILGNFDAIKNQILNAVREIQIRQAKESSNWVDKIQSSLLIDHEDWRQVKFLSSMALHFMLPKFDLSAIEKNNLEIAESIYFPWVQADRYSTIINDDNILAVLKESGSWKENRSPQSFPGLIITLANYAALNFQEHQTLNQVIESVKTRANFLKHQSIRSIGQDIIEHLENAFVGIKQKKAA